MGLFSWFSGSPPDSDSPPKPKESANNPKSSSSSSAAATATEVPGMNGAVEVPLRPPPKNVTVFEFGSVATSTDKVTLAGFCPVSEDLEPCRWEILPSTDSDAPQFRVVF
ncbi:unnamed protein product [Linum trigynum]|uniref:Allyl alcohol dehydrogenase-like protein n=1 Tax=Linum trigynum TaxID=586398 RepID=A0AAV2DRB1_9ROSI